MKFLILLALVALTLADGPLVGVIKDLREGPDGARYTFDVELDDGTKFSESGSEGLEGQSVAQGNYEFISPEGENIQVSYTADENGFVPQSAALPQDHPLPEHAQELIRQAEELRAQGVEWDERGFVL